ncbi:MAG: nuclear transport factor 2 family protein [Candidatus Thorarchaeota archaeon]
MTNHNKQLVRDLVECMNERDFDRGKMLLHPDVTFGVFMTSTGNFHDVKGINDVIAVLEANFGGSNDIIFVTSKIVCEGNAACLWGLLKGSTFLDVALGPFEVKASALIEFEKEKMIRFTWIPDTFAVMRLMGRVSFVSNDQDIINQYLDNLVEMGLIRETDRRLRRPKEHGA